MNGKVDGAHPHVLSFLGETWGKGSPRVATEQVVAWCRKISGAGAIITWDTPIQKNGLTTQPFMEQLTAVGEALRRQP